MPLQVHLEIPPPFYRAGAILLSASAADAADRAPRDRTIRDSPWVTSFTDNNVRVIAVLSFVGADHIVLHEG